MEKIITFVVRFIACGFILQPVIVVIVLLPAIKTRPSAFVLAAFCLVSLLCVVAGLLLWRNGPKLFLYIFRQLFHINHAEKRK
jgi:uncharacterized membrane protein